MIKIILFLCTILSLTACTTLSNMPGITAGTISNSNGELTTEAMLIAELAQADYILLGEIHDNIIHHQLQARMIEALIAKQIIPTVALEMLDTSEQIKIDQFKLSGLAGVDEFNKATGFGDKGWDFEKYKPLLASLLDNNLTLIASNLSRDEARKVSKNGLQSLPATTREVLAHFSLSKDQLDTMSEEIMVSHCNALPEKIIPGMVNAQIARDVTLAASMLSATKPVVLITGAGHARKPFAVPAYLKAVDNNAKIVSLSFLETGADSRPLSDFDFTWYTKPAKRDDPCIAFMKMRSKKK